MVHRTKLDRYDLSQPNRLEITFTALISTRHLLVIKHLEFLPLLAWIMDGLDYILASLQRDGPKLYEIGVDGIMMKKQGGLSQFVSTVQEDDFARRLCIDNKYSNLMRVD